MEWHLSHSTVYEVFFMQPFKIILFDTGPLLRGEPVQGMIRIQSILQNSIHLKNFLSIFPPRYVLESVFASIFLHTPCVVEDLYERLADEEHFEALRLLEQQPTLLENMVLYTDALKSAVITNLVDILRPHHLEKTYCFYVIKAWRTETLLELEYYR